jgi:hypothetical protein
VRDGDSRRAPGQPADQGDDEWCAENVAFERKMCTRNSSSAWWIVLRRGDCAMVNVEQTAMVNNLRMTIPS